mmetsp:Transcript_11834/g.23930  ORF Transcript_11834/g.23930 Transcript_11834/m.23930 type:complete len:327 (-) Transcript_11834:187-1167(-)
MRMAGTCVSPLASARDEKVLTTSPDMSSWSMRLTTGLAAAAAAAVSSSSSFSFRFRASSSKALSMDLALTGLKGYPSCCPSSGLPPEKATAAASFSTLFIFSKSAASTLGIQHPSLTYSSVGPPNLLTSTSSATFTPVSSLMAWTGPELKGLRAYGALPASRAASFPRTSSLNLAPNLPMEHSLLLFGSHCAFKNLSSSAAFPFFISLMTSMGFCTAAPCSSSRRLLPSTPMMPSPMETPGMRRVSLFTQRKPSDTKTPKPREESGMGRVRSYSPREGGRPNLEEAGRGVLRATESVRSETASATADPVGRPGRRASGGFSPGNLR